MNEELLRIIEGMKAENKALTNQGEQAKYGDAEFDSVVKTYQANNPVEEVKEAPAQPDVAVTEENTASNGEESSTESARLMANYRLEDEADEDFYSRITPVTGTQGPMIYNFNENKYVSNEAAISAPGSSTLATTIDGITKNNNGVYINQNNESATEEEILKFEELTTLNNIHNEALKLKSSLAGEHEMSDSELLDTFDKDNFEKKKKEKTEKGLLNDNLDYNTESFLNYKTKNFNDGFANFVAKTNAPLTAKHQGEFSVLAESKLPVLQEQFTANYQAEIDSIQKTLFAKYQKQADKATTQEEVDLINKELKKELDVALQPTYDNINKDINSALKTDKDVIALDEKYQAQHLSLQEQQYKTYAENWKPKSKHFGEEELNNIVKLVLQMLMALRKKQCYIK